jgi:DNA-binding LacI/PurR family transcriptional regulator
MVIRTTFRSADAGRRLATAHDVARLAGVSQSAVSRAFTTGASISAEMRVRVTDAAQQLGYRPNLVARSLITRRSNIIGVAMAYLENQFYPSVLAALSQAFSQRGYQVMLFAAKHGECSDPILEDVLRHKVDAVVLASASLSSRFDVECQNAGVPVVLLNRRTESQSVSSVTSDNRRGGETIAAFLAAGGHQRIAFMAGTENSSTSHDREEGFTGYLAAQGLRAPMRVVGSYDFGEAGAAARALLARPERPDALFCANDHMALAAINVARAEFGLEVGREISIVGFDDAGPAAWPVFSLTTYVQPIQAMVEQVIAITCAQLDDPAGMAVQRVVPGRLAVRDSARLPRAGVVVEEGVRHWRPEPAAFAG